MSLRLRKPAELTTDPHYWIMVGRLIGASEMTARYMNVHGTEEMKQLSDRLDDILQFFFVNDHA